MWPENPRLTLPAWIWPVVDLWFLCRRYASPMGGQPLPCPGSPAEQPAALMDAMATLDALAGEDKEG